MRTFPLSLQTIFFIVVITFVHPANAQRPTPSNSPGDALVTEYFRLETEKLSARTFAEIHTLEDWENQKDEYRRQLLEMLGLDPMPEKSPLQPVLTGTLEESGVTVERVHFQSMPGLYVTANVYRPSEQTGPLPAILYVCGHGGERLDGKSLGNKTHYQHHGCWFAKNGYVCLMIDTIQLGEIEGVHHGTYREKMWWWNNRGYSSAGVEAFNCVRSLDYLQSRDDVDGNRIGVTGRSGGGAYSWWIAAIDDRITAAVPVAGITSLKNHVVDGCVEGHCDCMYMVNTYRWDFPMVAALVAPRPLLITNSDKDRIFPLDGVVDVYSKVHKIYALYGASDKLGLQISEGPHKDTQELQVAAFRWMNRFLREDTELIEMAAKPLFEKRDLRVFDELPSDERVTSIHESFVPKVDVGNADLGSLADQIREKCFRGWPDREDPLELAIGEPSELWTDARVIEFTSQVPFRLKAFVFQPVSDPLSSTEVIMLDQEKWNELAPVFAAFFPSQLAGVKADPERAMSLATRWSDRNRVYLVPRGVGPTAWGDEERHQTHIRRRFMLLGQTLAGMQIFDVKRGLQAISGTPGLERSPLRLTAQGEAAFWSLYASFYVDGIQELRLEKLPERNRDAPDLLNISRIAELADVEKAAAMRVGK